MTNLKTETIKHLQLIGKSPSDIVAIGNAEFSCTWEEFLILADFEYDDGFGGQEVNLPEELTLEIDGYSGLSLEGAGILSDETGWLVESFNFEKY